MKVNRLEEIATTSIKNLLVGQTFTAPRVDKYMKSTTGYYMKIDKSSGIFAGVKQNEVVAVNLETGQLRKFDKEFRVAETSIECNIVRD